MHLVSAIVGQPQAQLSFNNYFPAVSYNIFYKLRISLPSICTNVSQIQRISTIRPFIFSIYFYDKPNVRVKTSRAASKTNCVNFQQKGRNNMRKKKERETDKGERHDERVEKKSEIQREKGVNERKDGRVGDRRVWEKKKVVSDDNGIPRNVISIASVIDQATRSEYGNWYRQGWTTVPTSAMSDVSRPVSILYPKIFSLPPSSATRQ